eukprot:TRINITY_DN43731_c0_g1_i1.p1 TRINITY_DN43731_c0_g1~~TRINITY_DN43731_c0_g1_i1.p1  ORF type:complete len:197 (+),score=24.24 TRINITY_DN43731_c0_g1_i1:85-675(+)
MPHPQFSSIMQQTVEVDRITDPQPKGVTPHTGPGGYRTAPGPTRNEARGLAGEVTLSIPPPPPRAKDLLPVAPPPAEQWSAPPLVPAEVRENIRKEKAEMQKEKAEAQNSVYLERPGKSKQKWGPAHFFALFGLVLGVVFTVLSVEVGWPSCIAFAAGGWTLFVCSGTVLLLRSYKSILADAEWLRKQYEVRTRRH